VSTSIHAVNLSTAPAGEWVVPLDRLRPADRARVGGKALNLGLMRQARLPVPDGFCVTTKAFEQWVAAWDDPVAPRPCATIIVPVGRGSGRAGSTPGTERLGGSLALPARGSWLGGRFAAEALDRAVLAGDVDWPGRAASLRDRLRQTPVPEPVIEAVRAALADAGDAGPWAVRSSATAEDQPDGSFAGQHDSFLGIVGPEAVIDAVRACWLSLFTDRALAYRARCGRGSEAAAMAVVVQEMVVADVAGVVFLGDPVHQDPSRIVIEGAPGCGVGVVSGRVRPDRMVLERGSLQVLERSAGDDAGGGMAHALSEQLARELARLALEAERLLGAPQDLEWAVRNGTAWVLQSRPITTSLHAASAPPEVWCNANVCENLPGVLTPMSWSLVELLLEGCFRPLLHMIGIDTDARPWFGRIAGRVYLNVGLSDAILRSGWPTAPVSVWDLLGGRPTDAEAAALERVRQSATRPSRRQIRRLLWLALRALPALSGTHGAAFLRALRQRLDALEQTPFPALSDAELSGVVSGIVPRLFPELEEPLALVRVFMSLSPAVACVLALPGLTRGWLGDADGGIACRLLGTAGDMASAEAALDLWRLAAWARQHTEVKAILAEPQPYPLLRHRLRGSPTGVGFLERWDAFVRRHGHHARGEVDAFNPRWSETPDELLDQIRHYLDLPDGFDPTAEQARRRAEREVLFEACRRRLRAPWKRWGFGWLVRRGQAGLRFRENVKSEAVRSVASLRAALLEAGRRLEARGLLATAGDVFYLEFGELDRTLRGDPIARVAEVIALRKAERKRLETMHPPSIVVGDFRPEASLAGLGPDPSANGALHGLGVSSGCARGRARVIPQGDPGARLLPGEILVVPWTDPGWTPLYLTAAGIVADIGGQLSHGSIIAREYGIPAVVNVGHATQTLRTGQLIEVDGDRGLVRVVESPGTGTG